jgi:large subunit ribosomal protein L17
MRHQKNTVRLGRKGEHRKALLANQVCNLIEHRRIKTTLAKAKAVRPIAERMIKKLFDEIAPASSERNGGYTRIIRLGQRPSDSAFMALIEWVDSPITVEEKPAEEKKAKKKEPKAEAKPKESKREEPKAKEKEAAPAEEPKKKRRWWGGKPKEDK